MEKLNIMFLGLMLMFWLFPLPVFAGENNVSKLIVQGEGKVSATPDMATIVWAWRHLMPALPEQLRKNAVLMNETIMSLLSAGIAEKDIQTSSFSLTTVPQDEQIDARREAESSAVRCHQSGHGEVEQYQRRGQGPGCSRIRGLEQHSAGQLRPDRPHSSKG